MRVLPNTTMVERAPHVATGSHATCRDIHVLQAHAFNPQGCAVSVASHGTTSLAVSGTKMFPSAQPTEHLREVQCMSNVSAVSL
jgi:hypothetical protein